MDSIDWLARRADLHPGRPALRDLHRDRTYTYQELSDRASRVAEVLRDALGVRPGDRVAILAHNGPAHFELLYGCARLSAVLVPLNWRLASAEIAAILDDCAPRALILDPAHAALAAPLLDRFAGRVALLPADDSAAAPQTPSSYEALLAQASGRAFPAWGKRGLDDLWYLLYTAGTTGRAKGVLQTYGMVIFNALNIGSAIDLTSADVTLNVLPFFHTGGLNLFVNPTLHAGGTALLPRGFDPAQTLQHLQGGATAFFGVPAIYLFLSQHPGFASADLSRVRAWACGGAPMPVSLLRTYLDRGIAIRQGCGMTESGPTCLLMDAERAGQKLGSSGKPQLHAAVRLTVATPGGGFREAADDEVGELWLGGPAITPGYYNQPAATAEALIRDEAGQRWLRSGDLARRDRDGYYYVVDRSKDMFISGGENVYPAEVENVLYAHPSVAEAAVIGVADERWGEVGRAYVVLKADADPASAEAALLLHCQAQLGRFKVPRSVVFLAALPRNAAGKVLKHELKRRAPAT